MEEVVSVRRQGTWPASEKILANKVEYCLFAWQLAMLPRQECHCHASEMQLRPQGPVGAPS
jgi:hypothetical protein